MNFQTRRPRPSRVMIAALALVAIAGVWAEAPVARAAMAQDRAAPGVQRGEAVDLRPKLTKGSTFRFRMELDSLERTPKIAALDPLADPSDATTDDGQDGKKDGGKSGGKGGGKGGAQADMSETRRVQDIVLRMTVVESNPETGSTLELVYEQMKMRMSSPELGDIEFDSSKPPRADDPAAAIAQVLSTIVGTTLTVTMDKDGVVTNVSTPPGATMGAESVTGRDVISGLVGQVFTMKKGQPTARVGESWTNDSVMSASWARTRVTTTNTLKSHRGGLADIAIRGSFAMEPSSPGQALAITIKDATLEGSASWNTEVGMLDAMNVTQQMTAEITMPTGPLSTTARQTTKVTRLK